MESELRMTIPGWEKATNIKILDPDGFDRKDRKLYSKLFTRREFLDGAMSSTIMWRGGW